ncbi:MAG: hypothetical protein ACI9QD_000389 [Thermoproteota archaeon]|jgi:hypothetical protein
MIIQNCLNILNDICAIEERIKNVEKQLSEDIDIYEKEKLIHKLLKSINK